VKNLFEKENFERVLEVNKVEYIGNQLWKNRKYNV
jgi:hypothetical protein